MEKIYLLLSQLQIHSREKWAMVANMALQDAAMKYVGANLAKSSVSDLIRLYEIRLARCAISNNCPIGLRELLGILKTKMSNDIIYIEPYISPTSSVSAFFDSTHNLLVCVTVKVGAQ